MALIEAEEGAGRSVKHACELFEVSRAAYYQRKKNVPSARAKSDAELLEAIVKVHTDSDGIYGAPRVHHELLARHRVCGRRVRRLMRQNAIAGRCKRRWKTTAIQDPDAQAEARDLIRRRFGPCEELDVRYVGDITYLNTWEGWAYGHRHRPGLASGGRLGPG